MILINEMVLSMLLYIKIVLFYDFDWLVIIIVHLRLATLKTNSSLCIY